MLGQKQKLETVKHEMARLGINVLGISKTRWTGEDDYNSDGFRIIHSGEETRKPARSSNNIRQKNSQLCRKGLV